MPGFEFINNIDLTVEERPDTDIFDSQTLEMDRGLDKVAICDDFAVPTVQNHGPVC